MADDVREMWSEDELDAALGALQSEVDTDDERLAGARAELLTAAGTKPAAAHAPRRLRRWTGWAATAATIVALAVGLVLGHPGNDPVASAAARELNSAAEKIGGSDQPLGPGQYRYIVEHAWWGSAHQIDSGKFLTFLEEHEIETWVPADERQEWMRRDSVTGNYKWIDGSDAEAKANGVEVPYASPGEKELARCGIFFSNTPGRPCPHVGDWQEPNKEFMASLPRDPHALYDRLHKDTAGSGHGPTSAMLVYVSDILRSGLVPADLRAALYRALALAPRLEITEKVANLDGRKGIAFGVTVDHERQEVIIDPATGQFIGEREMETNGTVDEYTSMTTTVVDHIGETR
jgi:hypothetical protein